MTITHTILKALNRAVERTGNPSKFAAKLPGVRQTTVRNWLMGITKTISEENWRKVCPLIKEELPELDEMHHHIDQIGHDGDLLALLSTWDKMSSDAKAEIVKLVRASLAAGNGGAQC